MVSVIGLSITLFSGFSLVVTLIVYAVFGTGTATAVLAGAGIGLFSLISLQLGARLLVRSARRGDGGGGGLLFLLLFLKFPILAGLLYVVVVFFAMDPFGLVLGVSALPLSLLVAMSSGKRPVGTESGSGG